MLISDKYIKSQLRAYSVICSSEHSKYTKSTFEKMYSVMRERTLCGYEKLRLR